MNKEMFYELFNNKIVEFVKDLIIVLPNEKDFKLFKNSLQLLITTDKTQPRKIFDLVITKYGLKEKILLKDEKFFLEGGTEELAGQENVSLDLIAKLKQYWVELKEDKETIWSYLILLCKISDKCS
jgi:hypothetical protein